MRITYEAVKKNMEIRALIEAGNNALEVRGFTDHGYGHAEVTARAAGDILKTLGYDDHTCELARIAGYIHDIGNALNRVGHAQSGALMGYEILNRMGCDIADTVAIMTAVGNHDEGTAAAVTPLSAALILADKSDVRRSRVRSEMREFDIHDRVNYAVMDSSLTVHGADRDNLITLMLKIDTSICAVMDYFEIFLGRMTLCREAATFLGRDFELIINETRML